MISTSGWRYLAPRRIEREITVVAVNVGGALRPVLVSLCLARQTGMYRRMAVGPVIVAAVVYPMAEVVPSVGIAVPIFVPPYRRRRVALPLAFRRAPPSPMWPDAWGA